MSGDDVRSPERETEEFLLPHLFATATPISHARSLR